MNRIAKLSAALIISAAATSAFAAPENRAQFAAGEHFRDRSGGNRAAC